MCSLNIRLSDDNFSLLKALSSVSGLSMNSIVNDSIEKTLNECLDNPELGPIIMRISEIKKKKV